jgi:hypothetical protein
MKILCWILIISGLILIVLSVLEWVGILITKAELSAKTTIWDFLMKLLDKAPWVCAIGIVLIGVGYLLCKLAA